jgi:hypothetical protein
VLSPESIQMIYITDNSKLTTSPSFIRKTKPTNR